MIAKSSIFQKQRKDIQASSRTSCRAAVLQNSYKLTANSYQLFFVRTTACGTTRMLAAHDLDALTRDYGREIFARVDRDGPLLFAPRWWDERLMDWTMGNPALKVQLFRFVDCLPLLHTPADITRHLREYFEEAGPPLPPWIPTGARWLPANAA